MEDNRGDNRMKVGREQFRDRWKREKEKHVKRAPLAFYRVCCTSRRSTRQLAASARERAFERRATVYK